MRVFKTKVSIYLWFSYCYRSTTYSRIAKIEKEAIAIIIIFPSTVCVKDIAYSACFQVIEHW